MAASLDGDLVSVGDSVFDVVWGAGIVSQLHLSGNFVVRFAGTRVATFTSAGVNTRYPGRTLFWRNPVVVVPTKDERHWLLIQQLVSNIAATVRGIVA